jgi:hypothetical protein
MRGFCYFLISANHIQPIGQKNENNIVTTGNKKDALLCVGSIVGSTVYPTWNAEKHIIAK